MDDKVLEAFSFGRIQECGNIVRKLNEHGIPWEEFIDWVDTKTQSMTTQCQQQTSRVCPECGGWLSISDVNATKCSQVDGDWKSMWYCDNCAWNELSEVSSMEEKQKYPAPATSTNGTPDEKPEVIMTPRPKIKKTKRRIVDPRPLPRRAGCGQTMGLPVLSNRRRRRRCFA